MPTAPRRPKPTASASSSRPAGRPWAHSFTMALARLGCIPDPGG